MAPRVAWVSRSRVTLPASPDLTAKIGVQATAGRTWLVSTGDVGRHDLAGMRLLMLPAHGPLASMLFYLLGPLLAVLLVLPGRRRAAVVCQSPYEGVVAAACLAVVPARVRPGLVVEVHADWRIAATLYGSRARRLLARPADRAATWALRRADRIRAVSAWTARLVEDAGMAVDDVHLAHSDFATFSRPTVSLPERPAAVFVGTLVRTKGLDVLLDAWPEVRAAVPDAELHVVGDGPLRDTVRGPGVVARGRLDRPRVADALDAGWCLVLPSRSEGVGLVVVEAMLRRRAVVAADVGGIPEWVDERCGRLVPVEDPGRLAAALVEVLAARQLAADLGAMAWERAVSRRPGDQFADGTERLARWAGSR